MTEDNVFIYMNSTLDTDSPDPQKIEFATEGTYKWEGDKVFFSYEESELTGLPGTTTSMTITPDSVILDRVGTLTGSTEFRVGEKNIFPLRTPYGQTMLGILAKKIVSDFNPDGGSLFLEFVTDFDHSHIGRNRIELEIKKQTQ